MEDEKSKSKITSMYDSNPEHFRRKEKMALDKIIIEEPIDYQAPADMASDSIEENGTGTKVQPDSSK